VVLLPLGFPQAAAGSTGWWLTRIPWIGALVAVLGVLVVVAGRRERRALRSPTLGRGNVVMATAAMTTLALHGFRGWPAVAAVLLMRGW
jgi:hypothetical protein